MINGFINSITVEKEGRFPGSLHRAIKTDEGTPAVRKIEKKVDDLTESFHGLEQQGQEDLT